MIPIPYNPWRRSKTVKKQPMETQILERTIIKIGGLLAIGLGEAGAEIIGQNMGSGQQDGQPGHQQSGDGDQLNAMVRGRKVEAIFCYCQIQSFTSVTEILQDSVMVFVNTIASIVHGSCDEWHGAPNKNLGDAFLLVWRLGVLGDDAISREDEEENGKNKRKIVQGVSSNSLRNGGGATAAGGMGGAAALGGTTAAGMRRSQTGIGSDGAGLGAVNPNHHFLADFSLMAYTNIIIGICTSPSLTEYRHHEGLVSKLGNLTKRGGTGGAAGAYGGLTGSVELAQGRGNMGGGGYHGGYGGHGGGYHGGYQNDRGYLSGGDRGDDGRNSGDEGTMSQAFAATMSSTSMSRAPRASIGYGGTGSTATGSRGMGGRTQRGSINPIASRDMGSGGGSPSSSKMNKYHRGSILPGNPGGSVPLSSVTGSTHAGSNQGSSKGRAYGRDSPSDDGTFGPGGRYISPDNTPNSGGGPSSISGGTHGRGSIRESQGLGIQSRNLIGSGGGHSDRGNRGVRGSYRVPLSFALHCGFAIEGAIGSEFKIDASYVGPSVTTAGAIYNLATTIYNCTVLLSG